MIPAAGRKCIRVLQPHLSKPTVGYAKPIGVICGIWDVQRFSTSREDSTGEVDQKQTAQRVSFESANVRELKAGTDAIRHIITTPQLDYRQRRHNLAALAESMLPAYPNLAQKTRELVNDRVICDLFEGNAPYRPRYTVPDWDKALRQGCDYLELPPPQDLEEALNFLLIMYQHTPSITGYPVYIGDIDSILARFVGKVDGDGGLTNAQVKKKLTLFWRAVDRMYPDGFLHANLGPVETRLSRIFLEVDREQKQTVPNLTLKVSPQTSEELLLSAIETAFVTAKPHFVDHRKLTNDIGGEYGVASCYNSLPLGGGSHTLVRLNVHAAIGHYTRTDTEDDFLNEVLPDVVQRTCEVIESRVRHIVEEAKFFNHNFMVKEGLLSKDRFTAMFGIFSVAEAVNHFMRRRGGGEENVYGRDPDANALAERMVRRIADLVRARPMPYCEGSDGVASLHAQSGIDIDEDATPGCRLPFEDEVPLFQHIDVVARLHKYFPAGVSDIFHFEPTVHHNPSAVMTIIRGAFEKGMRDFTFDVQGGEFVRVTGYLVRRSDASRFDELGSRYSSDVFAVGAIKKRGLLDRPTKQIPMCGQDLPGKTIAADPLDSKAFQSGQQGFVNSILPFSVVDGPGSRSVVFFQGCAFRCIHCHNPSTMAICKGCASCVPHCPHGALSGGDHRKGLAVSWDEAKCHGCDKCIQVCTHNADPHAQVMCAEDIANAVAASAGFIDGVTFTGGDPTFQPEFLLQALRQIKTDARLKAQTTMVDSNGYAPIRLWKRLLPFLDGASISLKAGTSTGYQEISGFKGPQSVYVLESVRRSMKFLADSGRLWEVRVVLIKDYNDTEEELDALAHLIRDVAPSTTVRLTPYNPHGVRQNYQFLQTVPMDTLQYMKDKLVALGHDPSQCLVNVESSRKMDAHHAMRSSDD